MKISMNWLLDHIATKVTTLDVGLIVAKFNVHTAEIESYEKFDADLQNLFLVRVKTVDANGISGDCPELKKIVELPFRNDLFEGQLALVRRQGDSFSWETLKQYGSSKEGLFPAVDCQDQLVAGLWKQECEDQDYIVDVDNKSINHRPDLWGHRGIAREVAAFMGWELKSIDQMLAQVPQLDYGNKMSAGDQFPLAIEIKDTTVCSRFAALYCDQINYKPSQIWMAMRLARVDSKPMNTIVDISNYVMFDLSNPMHIFDAASFTGKQLDIRRGKAGESLELLDGRTVNLSDQNIVITDGNHPMALAGVMGGKQSSFTQKTSAIIIESASFAASVVRNSAASTKLVTESAARFSKQLDPMQNIDALLRFMQLAQACGVMKLTNEKLVSLGKIVHPSVILVAHSFIESRLGARFSSEQIIENLSKLEFVVTVEKQGDDIVYHVTVPTNRTSKDITIPEDIVEEFVRLYGFENIAYQRPVRQMKPFDISLVMKLRQLKNHCAFALNMREVRDYLFYDESFLKRLGWYPTDAVAIKNPVSENWKVLVTSLIPHLIKNVELNHHSHEQINFFEYNSVWHELTPKQAVEHKSFAGIFFGHKNMSFYDYKAQLQGLFAMLELSVVWAKCSDKLEPWFDQLQSADIMLDGVKIGRAGMISAPFIRSVAKGPGFVFELHADLMLHYKVAAKKFVPWSKYQSATVDISLLVDAVMSAEKIEQLILATDTKIDQVKLVDFFEKNEWIGKRSLTFRYRICNFEQNLTKEVIDAITLKVVATMEKQGATVRL